MTKKRNFELVLKKGKVLHSPSFGLFFLKEKTDEPSTFGFVVSNKISKRAVVRNKIRRVFRETVRNRLPEITPGFSFVFLVKKNIVNKNGDEIKKEIDSIFEKI